jgi:excisionase family DNA binding protein
LQIEEKELAMQRRYFTTFEASHFLGVSLPTVVNWIKARRIKAHRTPGGHRRIAREELASFIRRHGMPMPPELGDFGALARILVVDDDRGQLSAMLSLLKRADYECFGAGDAFSAGLSIGLLRPDLALIDFSMPGADGATVIAALRANDAALGLPILAISGARDEKTYRRALAAGFEDLVLRPFDAEAVKRKIEQALRARRAA